MWVILKIVGFLYVPFVSPHYDVLFMLKFKLLLFLSFVLLDNALWIPLKFNNSNAGKLITLLYRFSI